MKVVKVIATITTTKDIYPTLVSIGSMHVAWSRWFANCRVVKPTLLVKVQNVQIIGGQRSLTKPSTDYIKFVVYQ